MSVVEQMVTNMVFVPCGLQKSFFRKVAAAVAKSRGALVAVALGVSVASAMAAPDFNISAYNYDTQPTPLPTSGTDTFRVSVGSVGDAPGTTPVQVSIQVPAGVAVVPGSFPSYCVLAGTAPVSPSTAGTQVLQCTLPTGAIGGIGTSTEINYVGRAVVPSNSAYAFEACIDNIFSNAYPVTNANCQSYPGDSDTTNDINGQSLLISAANDLGIALVPAVPENVVSGAPYTFTANITSKGLDPVPANQVQAEFNLQPGFQAAPIAAINAASPGWSCSQIASKITCVLSSAVASNPTGVLTNLPDIKIPGTVVAGGGTTGLDAAVASNDSVATIADPVPANNGPVIKTLTIQAGGNIKADKSFVGQPTGAQATLAVTATSTMRLTIASDAGGSPIPAGAKVTDDVSVMIAKGFTFSVPAGCTFASPIIECTTSSAFNAGGAVNFDIVVTHPTNVPATPAGINTAVVTAPPGYSDTKTADNTKTASYIVVPAYTDLEIIPFEAARKVPLGATITRGVGIKNNGPLPVVYGPANPLRAFGNIAPAENGGTGIPVCPATLTSPWQNCTVSGTRLLFDTGSNTGTLAVGATTPPASFSSTAPITTTAAGTGPNTQVCTGQKILDTLAVATSAGPNPPERTGVNGVNVGTSAPSIEYTNDCKNARGVEYIQNISAGDLTIGKTVATLNAGQACDASTAAGFAAVQTLTAVATNDNALCFKMVVKNENPNRAGVTWGDGGTYTHGAAKNYFISDNLPMYWGITGNAGENLPSTQSVIVNPPLTAGETCVTDFAASPPVVNCKLLNLAANATREMYVKVSRGMLDGTFVNTATTDSKDLLEPDDIPGSAGFATNAATATSVVNPVVDLVVAGKSLNPNPIPVGKLGQYVFTYKNLGPNPSQQARVEDVIDTTRWEIVGTPINTRGEACVLVANTPAAGRTTVRCDLNTTPFERTQEYQVAIQVRPLFPYAQPNNSADGFSDGVGSPGYVQSGGGLSLGTPVANMPGYTNTAVIAKSRAIEIERDLTNNNNSVLVKVAPPKFDLIVAKTDVGTGLNGDNLLFSNQVKYRITMVNSGESKITGVQMIDLKPVLATANVPNFGTATAVVNNGAARTLNFVSAVFEPSSQFASSGRAAAATPCTDNAPATGQIRCLSSTNAADQYMLPGESLSWVLTFDPAPNAPAIRGNLILPNRVRGASNEAPFDMTAAGKVDYDKDSVRNAVENTTWFAPMDLELTAKTTIAPTTINLNQTAQFNIDFRNNGPSPTRRVKITESLPPGFTFVTATFVKPAGSTLPGTAANYPVSCTGAGQNIAVCEIGDAAATVADFRNSGDTGQLQVIAKASNWAAVQAAGFEPTQLNNVATIDPGTNLDGTPLGKDTNSANNAKTSTIAVIETSISGRVCQVTQGATLAAAAAKNCAASPQGAISGTTIKICGTDIFGNALGGGAPGTGADCADATVSGQTDGNGNWKILVPPGTSYTVVETQPPGFSDYTEQPGTGGGTVAVGPNAATSPGLNFGPSADENKITGVAIPATGTPAARNPSGYNFTEIVNTGLAGFVYEDLNNNGIKDLGEPGIKDAVIALTGVDFDGNTVNVTATTSITGEYTFNVPPSRSTGYTLVQTQPAGYIDGKDIKGDTTGAQPPGSVIGSSQAGGNVAPGTSNAPKDTISGIVLVEALGQSQHNFGEIKTGTITGVVYIDSNGSVTKQGAEVSLPNVTITLTGTDLFGNSVNKSVQTNASGTYAFGGLLPGNYTVSEALVPGYTHTGSSVEGPNAVGATYAPIATNTPNLEPAPGTAAGDVASPSVNLIKLGPGGVSDGNNFGERGSDLSGRVCEDLNNDGICQPAEPSISGVTITLSGLDAAGNAVTRTAVTSATGSWVINDIAAPNSAGYTLEESQPPGYLDGRQSPGTLTPYAGNNSAPDIGATTPTDVTSAVKDRITGIKFNVATNGINYDFAEVKPASLQGFVYLDIDKNAARTPGVDVGIAGVTLELTGTNDMGQSIILVTTSTVTPDGSYTFANLRPGTYVVREIQPTTPSVFDGTVTVGAVTSTATPTNAISGAVTTEIASSTSGAGEGVSGIVLGSGGIGVGYNFGEIPRLSISGRVILDADRSGTINNGETSIPGVTTTITLCSTNTNPCTGIVLASTATDPSTGAYQFNDLQPGDYFVIETQPAGYASTTANNIPVTLTTTSVINRDFLETGADISGTVYSDNDASGAINTPTDTGISGVGMRLCLTSALSCTTPVATATTSFSGSYTFANVPAPPPGDSYFILENETTGPLTAYNNGTSTVGVLTGGSALANGALTPAEQGPSFTGDSKINAIKFEMPTTVATGPAPVIGLGYNFGELPIAGISGKVFVDRDFTNGTTGTFNITTDTPINTVTITLCSAPGVLGTCPSGNIVGTTTTSITGDYNFPSVPAGTYYVIESQPAGYGSSSPNEQTVVRSGSTPIANINFADTLAEIKGRVYQDNNGSGAYEPTDVGIGTVTVKLCLSSDAACASPIQTIQTTAVSGTYTFANVPAPPADQTYFIKEEQSTVPATLQNGTTTVGSLAVGGAAPAPVGTANTPNNTINGITWTPSTTPVNGLSALGTDYNFGELPTTTVSGAVILDRDFGGTQSPGDTGLPSTTTVTLCRSAPVHGQLCPLTDVVASTTTTPGSGTYTFPAVTPGTYYLVETQPVGYASSSPNTSAPVNVTTTAIAGINFYETGARLSGTVYKDVDYSGTNNAGDIPLPGVTVRVCTTANCAAGSVVASTTTSATGLYQFNDLPAPPAGQSYFVVEDQATVPPTPTVLSDGTTTVGAFVLTGTGGSFATVTAVQSPSRFEGVTWTPPTSVQAGAPAVVGTNFNFGEIDGFDVGGKVFFDANRNGGIDSLGDTPLAGVVMTLCRVATVPCPPTSVVGTTTTNVTGDYTFPRVPPGDYFVQETQPLGYGSVPTPAAPTATDVRPIKVAGTNVTGINFADTLSSIAGLVYRDDDGSQTRNGAETTMPAGITITLSGIDATGAAVTRTAVTNASGTYVFDNLRTGTYTITESQPAGFGNGGSNVGTLAGGTGSPNSNQITNIQLPVNTDAPNYNFGDVPRVAGVAGTIWRDNDHDRLRDADEPVLPGWTVQVLRTPFGGGTPTLVATAVSDANGAYSITGLEAGGGYSVRFIAPGGAIFGGAVDGEQGTPVSGASVTRGEITNLTLTATVTGAPNVIPQQSLPVDPSGVVYDSDTRLPVPGAQVRFEGVNCPAFDPAIHLVGGAGNQNQTVGPDGFYQFLLNNGAPACQYRIVVTPPGAYQADPAITPQAGPFSPPPRPGVSLIVPNAAAPQDGQPTTYFLNFNLNPNSQDVVNNHIPLVARVRPVLFVTKVANKSKVELGDTVKYTVKVRYASGTNNLTVLKVVDTMPAGFKLIADTSFVSVPTGAPAVALAAVNISGAPGAVVTYNIPVPGAGLAPGAEVELTYRVRVAVGSMQGDGINRAQARSTGTLRSNIAQAKVIVDPGVFTNDGCVAGKVFVDCNNNHIQDAEELGVPNVRMYMEDGTYFITDSEGKYSYCGLSPKSHVITIDMLTMPRGSRLTTTSNRNLGDANSMFLDVKNGQLIRADFAEGSCSNTVLEQVKARRTQGEVRSTDTEKKGQPALKWEGKSPQYPQQGTDGANQPLVVPRTTNGGVESAPEQNTPVPQMPGASSNTQGANVRNAK